MTRRCSNAPTLSRPLHADVSRPFDQTFQAMDAMDTYRAKAIEVMGQNNALIRDQLTRADGYVDRTRQAQAREAAGQAVLGTDGPVKM